MRDRPAARDKCFIFTIGKIVLHKIYTDYIYIGSSVLARARHTRIINTWDWNKVAD